MKCPYCLKSKGDSDGVYVCYDATTRQADDTILRELRIEGTGKSFDQGVCRRRENVYGLRQQISRICTLIPVDGIWCRSWRCWTGW